MDILSPYEVREMDRVAIAGGKPGIELMEDAGKGFVEALIRRFRDLCGKKVVVFTGKGNNGGDGFVAARHMRKMRVSVHVVMLAGEKEIKGDALTNYKRAKKLKGIKFIDGYNESIDAVRQTLTGCDIIVDAVFGTGFQGRITGRLRDIIELINGAGIYTAACDIPSGVNGDTGADGGGIAVNADMTVTFAYPKRGLFVLPGSGYSGNIEVVDIGLGEGKTKSKDRMITREEIRDLLKKRRKGAHKNDFGHVLVLAGSAGMTGAAALTCMAALRVGAGLVTLGIPQSLNSILEVKLTEAMTLPLPETERHALSLDAYKNIMNFIRVRKVRVIAAGPGLSTGDETRQLIRKVISGTGLPCVLDADGITAFSTHRTELRNAKAKIIITPHPGELARLINKDARRIQKSRVNTARDFARRNGLICVLKGYQTVVSDGTCACINATGNPGMASGGTGDVLTGMIAGLLCQAPVLKRLDAAIAGVYLHGLAGDIASEKKGEMSLIAQDLIDGIPEAIRIARRQ